MAHLPPDPRSPKEIWDEQHQLLAGDPVAWTVKAHELLAAAELVASADERTLSSGNRGPLLSSVALMLAGFAIEALLKGVLVQKTTPLNERGRFQYLSHDLTQLAEEAGLQLTDYEGRLLEKLEQFSTWAGRYPISQTSEAMRPRTLPNGGFAPRTYGIVGEDWPAIREFFLKLSRQLPCINHDGI